MKKLHLAFAAASLSSLLSGCNFYLADIFHDSPKQANNGFKYLSTDPDQKKFVVDQNSNNFSFNNKYYIKDETKNPDNAVIGRGVDISTPVQMISPIAGSATMVKGNHAYLNIKTADLKNIQVDNILMDRLLRYLKSRDISVESVDSLNSTIITGWYSSDYNFNKITLKRLENDDDIVEYRTKYSVTFRKLKSSEIVQMDVALTNFKAYHEGRRIYADPSSFVQNRFPSLFLNDYLQVFAQQTHEGAEYIAADRGYHSVKLGKDANGQYGWIITGSFDVLWPRFVKMLPKYGFAVLYEEKIRGIVDTNYDEEDEEFFEEQGVDNFVIEDDKYRFQMGVKGDDTIITIFDNSKQPLNDELFLKMYSGFAKALEKELN
jgi:uncharacterized lipoprotein